MSKIKKEKIVITGGAGLIGSYLAEILVQKNYDVTVIDDFSTGQLKNLINIKNKVNIIKGNLEDKNFCKNAFNGFDHIYHLASRAYGIGFSEKNHLNLLIHNETITNNLLEVFKKLKPKKILVVSSSCIYDENGKYNPNEYSLFGGAPEESNKGYGWAKRFLEQKFNLLASEIKAKLYIVRPFNIYGERYGWKGKNSQAIPMLIKKILDKENPVKIWGSGKQQRSYVHALDCAQLIYMIMNSKFSDVPINIGGYDAISIEDLVNLIMKKLNIKTKLFFDKTKPEGAQLKMSDVDQVSQLFPDYKYKIDLYEGTKRMAEWYNQTFSS